MAIQMTLDSKSIPMCDNCGKIADSLIRTAIETHFLCKKETREWIAAHHMIGTAEVFLEIMPLTEQYRIFWERGLTITQDPFVRRQESRESKDSTD